MRKKILNSFFLPFHQLVRDDYEKYIPAAVSTKIEAQNHLCVAESLLKIFKRILSILNRNYYYYLYNNKFVAILVRVKYRIDSSQKLYTVVFTKTLSVYVVHRAALFVAINYSL